MPGGAQPPAVMGLFTAFYDRVIGHTGSLGNKRGSEAKMREAV